MPTAHQLAQTYSFIRPLQGDPVLAKYGDNALPLFAIALHLDIDDLASFATESLTDHASDKKADIIYINEADGVVCVAQGYTARSWGKQAAPARKASDLNTAAAWLLSTPIHSVPNRIRTHAKLLRDGLQKRTITKIIFAYAHNAFESQNVEDELKTVRHLLNSLPLVRGADVEVVELGLRRIEALYLTSLGSIQVTDEVILPAREIIHQTGPGWRAFVLSLNGEILHDLYETHKNALFSANLRDFLGARRVAGNVNNRIQETAQKRPEDFFVLNNGITIVTKKAKLDAKKGHLIISGVSVVNGAQTTGAVHGAGRGPAKKVCVLARIITVDNHSTISAIVSGNNTQNSIVAWDRRSNDAVQKRVKQEFQARGVDYVHRRDSARKPATSIFADQIGQMLCAFRGDLQTAIRAKADIFESDVTYSKVFPQSLSIAHIYAIQALGWAYDALKQELKAKSESGNMTEIEQKQLRLLDFPASKQFLIFVAGGLREEIAGAKLTEPMSFQLKADAIHPDNKEVVGAWLKVLKSILPILVSSLPVEEYQLVRSTEHAEAVIKTTRAVLAGVAIVQSTFEDLRAFIGPR
ncbi:AIPR family protein [Paludibaculum fermentans]|uniref:AIPR family protein n=1 Tax=Paludibaculum fermentans TaxID=1473598 RepID=A0A7S7SMY2_PALFE|nr:AIPR family protein [Paludibaculum fermentans]QOY90894.1 AIPR family protein [Paludibaculum fermentans]